MTDTVLFQTGDSLSETNLGEWLGRSNLLDYVERGLGLNPDYQNDTLEVKAGKFHVDHNGLDLTGVISSNTSGLALTTSDVNHVFVAIDPANDDDIYFHIDTDNSAPADPSIKIGEVDTSADTKSESFNREPDLSAESLTMSGPVSMGGYGIGNAGNVDINEGKAIRDDGGTKRFSIGSTGTEVYDDVGKRAFLAQAGTFVRLEQDDEPIRFRDNANNTFYFQQQVGGPVEVRNTNFRIGTGQSIEDGSGTARLGISSGGTSLLDQDGRIAFQAKHDSYTRVEAFSTQPFIIRDEEGGFNALRYDTDTGAGVFRTPGAGARIEDNGAPSSGSGLELMWSSNTSNAIIRSFDRSNSNREALELEGNNVQITSYGGVIDASGQPANLRLETGQAIEDKSGNNRLRIASSSTFVEDDAGDSTFEAKSGTASRIYTRSTRPFTIFDREQGGTAVQYDTDTSVGVLRTPGAGLRVEANGFSSTGKGLRLRYDSGSDISFVESRDNDNSTYEELRFGGSLYDFSQQGAGSIRIDTGQSIEDGGGTERVTFRSGATEIKNDVGEKVFSSSDSGATQLNAFDGQPVRVKDKQGDFTGFQYKTGTQFGNVELTNSVLRVKGGTRPVQSNSGSGAGIAHDHAGSDFDVSSRVVFITNSGDEAYLQVDNGTLKYTDPSGNTSNLA